MKLGHINHNDVATYSVAEIEERFVNRLGVSSEGFIDKVIYPHPTLWRIALGLQKLRNKALENIWK